MIAEEIYAEDLAEDATKFDDYDEAIIGYTEDGRLVYDGNKIVKCLENDMSYSDAVEFYSYNVVRTLPYMGEHAPVIMWRLI